MKSLSSFIFLFLFTHSAYAGNLCETSCEFTITFPTGGSIVATEVLTFTFGTDGVLDLGATGTINTAVQPDSTDYSAGGALTLAAGESIDFDAGGALDLGTGGAISDTNITVTTDGEFNLQVVSEADSVYIGDITINGAGSLVITVTGAYLELGSIVTHGDITITADAINVGGSIDGSESGNISLNSTSTGSTSCTTSNSSDVTIISGTYDLVTSSCNVIDAGVIAPGASVSLITLDSAPTISYVAPVSTTSNVILNTATTSSDVTLTTAPEITIDGVLYTLTDDSSHTYTNPEGVIGIFRSVNGETVFVPNVSNIVTWTIATERTIDGVLYTHIADTFHTYSDPDGIPGTIQSINGETVFVPEGKIIEGVLYTSNNGSMYTDPEGVEGTIQLIEGEEAFVPFVTTTNALTFTIAEPLVDGDVVDFFDGDSCVVQGDECITEDGEIFEVNGSLVNIPIDFTLPYSQGWELLTVDGAMCTVADGKCIDENGVEYRMTEEGLVKVEGSGSINLGILLVLFSLLYTRRFELNIFQHPIMLYSVK